MRRLRVIHTPVPYQSRARPYPKICSFAGTRRRPDFTHLRAAIQHRPLDASREVCAPACINRSIAAAFRKNHLFLLPLGPGDYPPQVLPRETVFELRNVSATDAANTAWWFLSVNLAFRQHLLEPLDASVCDFCVA